MNHISTFFGLILRTIVETAHFINNMYAMTANENL
jgi:hypothetical protein